MLKGQLTQMTEICPVVCSYADGPVLFHLHPNTMEVNATLFDFVVGAQSIIICLKRSIRRDDYLKTCTNQTQTNCWIL